MRITPVEISPLAAARAADRGEVVSPVDGGVAAPSFESVLGQAIGQVNAADAAASQKASALATGAIDDLHGTMIAVKEADIAVKLAGTVRNKLLDAFQELWKTSV
jgi:flagellar hook-basal body complex protein FliE